MVYKVTDFTSITMLQVGGTTDSTTLPPTTEGEIVSPLPVATDPLISHPDDFFQPLITSPFTPLFLTPSESHGIDAESIVFALRSPLALIAPLFSRMRPIALPHMSKTASAYASPLLSIHSSDPYRAFHQVRLYFFCEI